MSDTTRPDYELTSLKVYEVSYRYRVSYDQSSGWVTLGDTHTINIVARSIAEALARAAAHLPSKDKGHYIIVGIEYKMTVQE